MKLKIERIEARSENQHDSMMSNTLKIRHMHPTSPLPREEEMQNDNLKHPKQSSVRSKVGCMSTHHKRYTDLENELKKGTKSKT